MYINDVILIVIIGVLLVIYNTRSEKYIPEYNNKELLNMNYQNAFLPPTYSLNTRTLNDPLYPPYKVNDYVSMPQISTRGCPSAFKKYGFLKATCDTSEKYKFLILMGRRSCISNSLFDYYAIENNTETYMKFDICNTKELLSGDEIYIHALNQKYIVHIDRVDTAVYCPNY
jgi:hypothetical protein